MTLLLLCIQNLYVKKYDIVSKQIIFFSSLTICLHNDIKRELVFDYPLLGNQKPHKAKVKMGIQRVATFEWSFPFGSFGHHSYHRMWFSSLKKLLFLFHAYDLPTQITKQHDN